MFKKLFSVASLTLCLAFPALALDAAKEYEIKAAFLFNLGKFVTWPDRSFKSADAPLYICVLGNDPFGEWLDVITADQTIFGHPVAVRRIATAPEALECHSVFISDSEQLRVPAILAALKNQPVLTVSDMDNFVVQGGMVQFFPHDNNIRLMLDPEAFSDASLKASSRLMQLAQLAKRK